jgi:beta-galactosidase
VVDQPLAERLAAFVRAGGTLVCEPETGAYDARGIFRYPEERFPARLTGLIEIGRRALAGVSTEVEFDGRVYTLPAMQWLEPLGRQAGQKDGERLVVTPAGKGRVVQVACYAADPYLASDLCGAPEWNAYGGDFEEFVLALTRQAGVVPAIEVEAAGYVYVKTGTIDGQRAAYVIQPSSEPVRLRFTGAAPGPVTDLIRGARPIVGEAGWIEVQCDPLLGVALLVAQKD